MFLDFLNTSRGVAPRQRAHRPDHAMLVTVYGLLLWGVVVIYSIGPVLSRISDISVGRQLIAVGISTVAFWFAAKLPLNFWQKSLPIMIVLAIVTSLLLLLPGDFVSYTANGARRWLDIGGVSFQPSELTKLTLVLYLAGFLANRFKHNQLSNRKKTLFPILVILGAAGIFVGILQKDLGTLLVIAIIAFAMLLVAGLPKKDLLLVGVIGLASAALLVMIAPHRISRVTTFFSPDQDLIGSGYHINQSLIAIGSGGLSGRGVVQSIQAFGYLPEAANDSIFAIHAETVGFIGVLAMLLAFTYLLRRIYSQAMATDNLGQKLIITGVMAWLASHIIINIGAMLGLLPLTGITLPLLSYGGSSMVLMMTGLGLVFNLSRYSNLNLSARTHSRTRR